MDTVRRYVAALNDCDPVAMAALCANPMQILDGMAPHVWQGKEASAQWWAAVLVEAEHRGTGDYRITLDEPRHVDISDRYAYVVVPATMAITREGRPHVQTGAMFVAGLRDIDGVWRLTAWSWAKGD